MKSKSQRAKLIERKIARTQTNLEYNKVELEFAKKTERKTDLYEKRIAEAQKDLKVLEEMKKEEGAES